MNWSTRGNVLNQYLRNTSIGTTVINNEKNFILEGWVSATRPGKFFINIALVWFKNNCNNY
jgi:hypothetical protein